MSYKKIFMSASTIAFVTALVVGGTGAFFSDTETSAANTFTAGAIDLTVDSEAHYNGSVCLLDDTTPEPDDYTWQGGNEYPVGLPCTGTWEATDLGAETFFNFDDVKPGDEGENTISLHVTSNPAWACVDVNITQNDDVSSNEPELESGDAPDTDSIFDGELAQNLNFAAWLDQGLIAGWQGDGDPEEGDNIWQGEAAEPLFFSNETGPASDVLGGVSYPLADSNTGFGPMTADETNYIGLAWCAGDQVVDTGAGTITCDGAGMGNDTQTDSMEASIAFRVEQSRNNPDFVCESPVPQPDTTNSLRLENETEVTDGPWIVHSDDDIFADLTWVGDGPTFDYTLNAQGLAASTNYSLIYYADGWPGNNPGALIGTHTTDGAGAIVAGAGNPDLGIDLPSLPDGNFAAGAKIWLVLSSDYNAGTNSMIGWNPSQYLFEGNVYIHYDDTDSL